MLSRLRRIGQTAALVLLLAHAPLVKAITCYTATGYAARLSSSLLRAEGDQCQ